MLSSQEVSIILDTVGYIEFNTCNEVPYKIFEYYKPVMMKFHILSVHDIIG